MRKSRYSRDNGQSSWSNYASSASSVRDPIQMTNTLHEWVIYMQCQNQFQIQSVGRTQKCDKRTNIYHDLVETSSAQKQSQVQHDGSENQYVTKVTKRFYGQVTYDNQN